MAWDDVAMDAASEGLAQALEVCSPRVSVVEHGRVLMEPTGSERLFAARVLQIAERRGTTAGRVGVADSAVAAWVAADVGPGAVRVVPAQQAPRFLAQLPLERLPLGRRTRRLLAAAGIKRVADLQALPVEQLVARFGPEGRRLYDLAWGQTRLAPRSRSAAPDRRVEVPLLAPVQDVSGLVFVLRRSLGALVGALEARGRAITRVDVELELDRAAPWTCTVRPARPTSDVALLVRLARTQLERFGTTGPGNATMAGAAGEAREVGEIVGLAVVATRDAPGAPRQGDLFSGHARAASGLDAAVSEIVGALGEAAIVTPRLRDSHRPEEAWSWVPGLQAEPDSGRPQVLSPVDATGAALRILPVAEPIAFVPTNLTTSPLTSSLTLLGRTEQISAVVGPERLSGSWWQDPFERDCYWVVAESGRTYWVYRDGRQGRWLLHGWLD